MYNFTQTFLGVPLSQIDHETLDESDDFMYILQNLTQVETIDGLLKLDVEDYLIGFEYTEEEKELLIKFIDWVNKNQKVLKDLDFAFHQDYNGGGDYPQIFGTYNAISLPDYDAAKLNINELTNCIEKDKQIKDLFLTMPKELINRFPPFGNAGLWSNIHSS